MQRTWCPLGMRPVVVFVGVGSAAGIGVGGKPSTSPDLGVGDPSHVLAVGDSWMNLESSNIQQHLGELSGHGCDLMQEEGMVH